MSRFLRVLSCVATLAVFGVFAASCGSSSRPAQYRVVHAIPGAPDNLDISVNGKQVFTNLAFGTIAPSSGYQSVSAGSDPIEAFLTGTSTPVITSTPLNLEGGWSQSTAVLLGAFATPTVVNFPDNNTAPPANQAEIRIIDASPSAPPSIDIYLVAPGTDISQVDPVISALSFDQASIYINFPVQKTGFAQVMVIVTAFQSKTQLINQTYTLASGQVRTLIVVDVASGGSLSFTPLELSDLD